MVTTKPPFETSSAKETYKLIKKCDYAFPQVVRKGSREVSKDFKRFVAEMLEPDQEKRLTAQQVLDYPYLRMMLDFDDVKQITEQKKRKVGGFMDKIIQTLANFFKKDGVFMSPLVLSKDYNDLPRVIKYRHYDGYGMLYEINMGLLNNGSNPVYGAYFNDATLMVVHQGEIKYKYSKDGKKYEEKIDTSIALEPSVQKKLKIMDHLFSKAPFDTTLNLLRIDAPLIDLEHKVEVVQEKQVIFVMKWIKLNKAIFFRLSNNMLQVNFIDGSQVILANKGHVVSFTPSNGKDECFITESTACHSPIMSRLVYINDTLSKL